MGVAYVDDGDRLVVAAAFGGAHIHPAWYLNLLADVEVEIRGRHVRPLQAHPASPTEREVLWNKLTAAFRACTSTSKEPP